MSSPIVETKAGRAAETTAGARRPCVFIHTNPQQMVGALVAAYALKRNSHHADRFDVEIINSADHAFLSAREGQSYMRDGVRRTWRSRDLQSFTPLRFMPPELMGYQGRAIVIDPDIFAVADVWELLSRDMGAAAIMCRKRSGPKGWYGCFASSVMLLDCAKLTHWRCQEQFNAMFDFKLDYMDWISLKREPAGSIGLFEKEWNDFDRLTPATRMLHNTRRRTQPWKTGLPIDFTPADAYGPIPAYATIARIAMRALGRVGPFARYWRHPDSEQERLFFGLLRECLDKGIVTQSQIEDEMRQDHVRHDAIEVIRRITPLPQPA
ncbi:MAG: hypothetical protein P9C48_05635 [Defluviicoccus sp.]|nr:hypothetical protein [Defluviicoccus sp.]MDG4608598.1 hypothetical protein [Defluviicoccus sp.]